LKDEEARIKKEQEDYKKDKAEAKDLADKAEKLAHDAAMEKDDKKRRDLLDKAEEEKRKAIKAQTKAALEEAEIEH
jgi:hypothetical protein